MITEERMQEIRGSARKLSDLIAPPEKAAPCMHYFVSIENNSPYPQVQCSKCGIIETIKNRGK